MPFCFRSNTFVPCQESAACAAVRCFQLNNDSAVQHLCVYGKGVKMTVFRRARVTGTMFSTYRHPPQTSYLHGPDLYQVQQYSPVQVKSKSTSFKPMSKSLIAVCTSCKQLTQCKWLYVTEIFGCVYDTGWQNVIGPNQNTAKSTVKIESGLGYKSSQVRVKSNQSQIKIKSKTAYTK